MFLFALTSKTIEAHGCKLWKQDFRQKCLYLKESDPLSLGRVQCCVRGGVVGMPIFDLREANISKLNHLKVILVLSLDLAEQYEKKTFSL